MFQNLSIWIYAINGVLFLFALFFIVHAARSNSIYRPFNIAQKIIKAFWIVLLLTLSLPVFIGYIAFAFLVKDQDSRPAWQHTAFTTIFLAIAVLAISPYYNASPIDAQLTKERQGEEWVVKKDQDSGSLSLNPSLNAGIIQSKVSSSHSSSVSSSNRDNLSAGRIAIVVEDDNPFLEKAALLFFQKLGDELDFVQQVELYTKGQQLPSGETLPDYWVRLQIPQYNESLIGKQMHIHSDVFMVISMNLFDTTFHAVTGRTPPVIILDLNANIQFKSKSIAVYSPQEKYKLPAEKLAAEFLSIISKEFNKNAKKHGVLTEEYAALVPKTEKQVDPPAPLLAEQEPLVHGTKMMVDYLSIRVFDQVQDATSFYQELGTQLQERGWKIDSEPARQNNRFAKYKKDIQHIDIYPEKKPIRLGFHINKEKKSPLRMVVVHKVYMPDQKIEQILEQKLDENPSLDFLLTMRYWFTNNIELRKKYNEKLLTFPANTADLCWELARFYQYQNNPEKEWLHRKKAQLLYFVMGDSTHDSSFKREWKRFYEKHPDFEPPMDEEEMLQSLYAHIMKMDEDEMVVHVSQVKMNQPIIIYRYDKDDKLQAFSATMVPNLYEHSSEKALLKVRVSRWKGCGHSAFSGHQRSDGTWEWENRFGFKNGTLIANSTSKDVELFDITLEIQKNP